MRRPRVASGYVVCLSDGGYRASLVVRRIYRTVPDEAAGTRGLLRVIDESGEDYLYPQDYFRLIELPIGLAELYSKANRA